MVGHTPTRNMRIAPRTCGWRDSPPESWPERGEPAEQMNSARMRTGAGRGGTRWRLQRSKLPLRYFAARCHGDNLEFGRDRFVGIARQTNRRINQSLRSNEVNQIGADREPLAAGSRACVWSLCGRRLFHGLSLGSVVGAHQTSGRGPLPGAREANCASPADSGR